MRDGYILLHRQGITLDDWKNPRRTLAWLDFLTLANYEDAVVTVSYGFLAKRWRISKGTVHFWIQGWITERQVERLAERSIERNAERFFVVNYAKYQKTTERFTERNSERKGERKGELRYKVSSTPSVEHVSGSSVQKAPTPSEEAKKFFEDTKLQEQYIQVFTSKAQPQFHGAIRSEFVKFVSYWTEPNGTGKKVAWQLKKTFDVKRRLVTWMQRAGERGRYQKGSLNIPKGL